MAQRRHAGAVAAAGAHRWLIGARWSRRCPASWRSSSARAECLSTIGGNLLFAYRARIVELAARHRLPAVYGLTQFTDAGGLMACGADAADGFRRAAVCIDKILEGARPGELPIEQATRFRLVLDLRTARALGLVLPRSMFARADEIIG